MQFCSNVAFGMCVLFWEMILCFIIIIIITCRVSAMCQLPFQGQYEDCTNFLITPACRFDFLPTLQMRKLSIGELAQAYIRSRMKIGNLPFTLWLQLLHSFPCGSLLLIEHEKLSHERLDILPGFNIAHLKGSKLEQIAPWSLVQTG